MDNVEMNTFQVQEMTSKEVQAISGGFIAKAIAILSGCIYVYNNWDDLVQGVKDGWNGEYDYNPS